MTAPSTSDRADQISLQEQEALVMSSSLSEPFKCECMMTLALQGNRPCDVFNIAAAYGVKKGTSEVTDIFLRCAANLVGVDDLLKEHSIAPPPPTFIPEFPSVLTPFKYSRRLSHAKTRTDTINTYSTENVGSPQLSPGKLRKLSVYFDNFTGVLTSHLAKSLAEELDVTEKQVRNYLKSRKVKLYRLEKKKEKELATKNGDLKTTEPD